MNKYKKLLANSSIIALGAFTSKVLVFLLLPLYSSVMSTSDYGIADIVAQSANLLQPLITFGICNAVFRFAFGSKKHREGVFTTGITAIAVGIPLFLLLSLALRYVSVLTDYMMLLGLYVFMYGMHTICAQFLRGLGLVGEYAKKGVFCTAATLILNILLLLVFRLGVVGYLLANILADFFTILYMFRKGKLLDYINFKKLNPYLALEMLKYSLPLIPTTVFWWITNISDRYAIIYMIDESASGIYAMSYKLPNVIVMLTGVFIEAWQMSLVEESKKGKMGQFFTKIFESYKAVLFIVCSVMIIVVKPVTKILIRNDFYEAWRYTPYLIIATACMGLVSFISVIFLVEKKSVNSLICSASGAGINIVCNIILIKPLGINGAAIATMLSYFIVYLIATYRSRLYVRYRLYLSRTVLNTGLLLAQSIIMVSEVRLCYVYSSIVFIIITAINLPRVYHSFKKIIMRKN